MMKLAAGDREHALNAMRRGLGRVPGVAGRPVSILARLAGVVLALAVAATQSYDRTRALAALIALLIALTLLPARGPWRGRLAWWGAGLATFGGATLMHLLPGALLLAAGGLAAVGALFDDQRGGRPPGVAGFFAPIGVVIAAISAILLIIPGS